MALPPHTIRIKRRRNEDPVQTLIVESKRRRVDGEFCFILHDTVESSASSVTSGPPVAPGSGTTTTTTTTEPSGSKQQVGIPLISTSKPAQDDLSKDGFKPGSFNEAALSDREGRPIAADRRLPIASREIKKAVSPARSARLRKKQNAMASRHKLSESLSTPVDPIALSPTKADVRRYHLSKKVKVENGGFGPASGRKRDRGLVPVFIEGMGRVAKKRSALKIGKGDPDEGSDYDEESDDEAKDAKAKSTKKPQTHFKERQLLQKQRSRDASRARQAATAAPVAAAEAPPTGTSELDFAFESDELAKQLQDMVLDYIANQPDLQNYPATTAKSPVREKPSKRMEALGGGVGGGTWGDVEKSMDVDANQNGDAMKVDSDGEDGEWVYDVYFREELKKNQDGSTVVTTGDYGVLVISNSDDEQWWYENDEDEESASDMWGSEDEDSNAEEYYKNDYPDEDDYDGQGSDDEFYGTKRQARPRFRGGQKKRGVWDYNSDGSYDLERGNDSN